MSLFDLLKTHINDALGDSPEGTAAASNPGFASGIVALIEARGLAPLVEKFKAHGLADVVQSWIGKGENLPISAEMIQKALSPESIEALARKAGIPAGQTTTLLAKVLPAVVDRLTPNGRLEDAPANP